MTRFEQGLDVTPQRHGCDSLPTPLQQPLKQRCASDATTNPDSHFLQEQSIDCIAQQSITEQACTES